MGFPRQEYWSGLPCPSPGDFPNMGMELGSPALQVDSLQSEPTEKPIIDLFFFFKTILKWLNAIACVASTTYNN